jgi:hypothetical protein
MTEPEFVTFRELTEQLEKVNTRIGCLDDKLEVQVTGVLAAGAEARLDTERRFGRIEKLLAAGGALQTLVWGAVALAKTDAPVQLHALTGLFT